MERKITPEYVFNLLNKNYTFYEDFSKEDEHDLINSLNGIKELDDIEWRIDTGISKLVIIFVNQDFVIKIPFSGRYDFSCNYENDYCEECDGDCEFCEYGLQQYHLFDGAYSIDEKDPEIEWDYCRMEVEFYQKAREMDIDFCLAETRLLGKINGYPIYTQTKADVYASNWSTYSCRHSEEQRKAMKDYCHTHKGNCFNSNWLIDLRNAYGDKVFLTFMDFIEKTKIEDLHNGNVGYIGDCPVLIDYSDYKD